MWYNCKKKIKRRYAGLLNLNPASNFQNSINSKLAGFKKLTRSGQFFCGKTEKLYFTCRIEVKCTEGYLWIRSAKACSVTKCCRKKNIGKPYEEKLHVRFDKKGLVTPALYFTYFGMNSFFAKHYFSLFSTKNSRSGKFCVERRLPKGFLKIGTKITIIMPWKIIKGKQRWERSGNNLEGHLLK